MLNRRTFVKALAAITPAAWMAGKVGAEPITPPAEKPNPRHDETRSQYEDVIRKMREAWVKTGHPANSIYFFTGDYQPNDRNDDSPAYKYP